MYDIRTAILPFLFIFNTQLLLIGIDHWIELIVVIASATVAMLLFPRPPRAIGWSEAACGNHWRCCWSRSRCSDRGSGGTRSMRRHI